MMRRTSVLIVHAILFAHLPQALVLIDGVFKNRSANCFGRLILMFANDLLNL